MDKLQLELALSIALILAGLFILGVKALCLLCANKFVHPLFSARSIDAAEGYIPTNTSISQIIVASSFSNVNILPVMLKTIKILP